MARRRLALMFACRARGSLANLFAPLLRHLRGVFTPLVSGLIVF